MFPVSICCYSIIHLFIFSHPSLIPHLIVLEGFACPSGPRNSVVGDFMALVGSPKTNRGTRQSAVQTASYDDEHKWISLFLSKTRATSVPPWSQAWVWGSMVSSARRGCHNKLSYQKEEVDQCISLTHFCSSFLTHTLYQRVKSHVFFFAMFSLYATETSEDGSKIP